MIIKETIYLNERRCGIMERQCVLESVSVLDLLYDSYREQHPVNTVEIGRKFVFLADILNKLPLKEHDQVWDLTCDLCMEHERNGFLEGIRMGTSLCLELMGK